VIQSEPCVSTGTGEQLGHGDLHAYHDARYSTFSKIEPIIDRFSNRTDSQSFDLVHISNPRSSEELVRLCSAWWPKLSPTGVGLVSGYGQFDESSLRSGFYRVSLDCFRVLQMDHWLAITSRHPIGVARDLILSSTEDLEKTVSLFQAIAGYVAWPSTKSQSETEQLRANLATSGRSEVDAQIRFGQRDLRLIKAWAENEKLTAQLQNTQAEMKRLVQGRSHLSKQEHGEQEADGSANSQTSTHREPTATDAFLDREGRDLWDECGRSVVTAILSGRHVLAFPKCLTPLVSIIVVLRNNIHLSVLCLASVFEESGSDYELIVVDNGSSDDTSHVLSLTSNVTVIRNEGNAGFGPACMQAAAHGSGEFLCFLNNDALLQPGSLSTAVKDCVEDPEIAAVGGKILDTDGKLQEAGCIVWRDGRTHQYGRGDDPSLFQYSFRRPVDYCSGVFLVTPRETFEELGGFDPRYAPAYYEDVDYCMKAWSNGKKVIYEPRSTVCHYENASSRDRVAALEKVIINHEKFTSRWHSELALHQIERAENVFKGRIAVHAGARRVLYFFGNLPTRMKAEPDARFASVTSLVKEGSQVTCVFTTNDDGQVEYSNNFPIDVELLDLGRPSGVVLKAYFEATDEVILAPGYRAEAQTSELLQEYAVKVTGFVNRTRPTA
jgi:GT2 family glycosyltransferase